MLLETVIFGGGAAGLWLLQELTRRGMSALLLEAGSLGGGQTVASQGIIHGGLKYTLQGLLTGSARHIREMPGIWRDCLAGRREPALTATRLRAESCYLWRTESLSSRLGMIGAQVGLRVAPEIVDEHDRPAVLARCPGQVARLNEQVIAPESLIADLSRRALDRILLIDAEQGLEFELDGPGGVTAVRLTDPRGGQTLVLRPKHVVLAAGAGNGSLRIRAGLPTGAMQLRPLHMVMARGPLPVLNGHCVDGARTRATITSDVDAAGRTVWQIGGQIAEDGVAMDESTLIAHARRELEEAVPGVDLEPAEWAAYRINRAEGTTPNGGRPETVQILREGNVVSAWPTKLALAPLLAEHIVAAIDPRRRTSPEAFEVPSDWPRPSVARPPWETALRWHRLSRSGQTSRKAA